MDHNIYYLSATALIEAIKQRKLSAVEVMEAHLDRIEKLNPIINGLVQQYTREECLKKASYADMEVSKGHPLGKLHGLPVTLKDLHLAKGLISSAGCTGLKGTVAHEDSTIVSRLRKEGAIVVGLTNVSEFYFSYETDNSVYGRTNNPYDLMKTAGGSSGGCSALVAAGCIPLSIAGDGGGSIRWPAHCTGVAAHKPTIGLVPHTGSVMGNAFGLMSQFFTSGPMARSVEDLALVLPIMSGPDGCDPHTPPVQLKDPKEVDVHALKVACFSEDGVSHISSEIDETLKRVTSDLKQYIKNVDWIELKCVKETYRLLWEGFFLGGDRGEGLKNLLAGMKVETPSKLMQQFLQEAEKVVSL